MNDNMIYRLVLVALLLQLSISLATSDTFHIVTSPSAPCPGEFIGEPCLTLQQYVSNPSISHGNITLLFETGTHSMSHAFSGSNAHSYTLSGYNVSIECISNTVSFTLTSIQHLNITGLKLSNCGLFRVSSNYTSFSELQFSNCGSFVFSSHFLNFTNTNFSRCGSFGFNSISYMFFTRVNYSNCRYLSISGSTAIEWSNVKFIRNSNVYFSNSEFLNMKNCSFTSIPASPSLYLSSIQNGSISYSSFTNNQFRYAYRLCNGGALYLDRSELSLYRNTFSNNHLYCSHGSYGGALYASNSRLAITKNTFFYNYATYSNRYTTANSGGAMYTSNCVVYSENNSFIQNYADSNGGAIYMDYSHLTLLNTVFTNNSARLYNGGGLYFQSNGNITITNSSFIGNRANTGGGMYVNNVNSVIHNGNTFTQNNGGGVYINNVNSVIHNGNTFTQNNGGGVFIFTANSIIMNTNRFEQNRRVGSGGGMCIGNSNTIITNNNNYVDNNAEYGGGGMCIGNSNTIITNNNNYVDNNAGVGYGGGLYIGSSNTIITNNNNYVGNNASYGRGGGMHIGSSNTIITNNNNYVGNNAGTEGGGVYFNSNNKIVTHNNEFVNNTANSGGAISSRSPLSLYNTYFTDNLATRYGGSIYMNSVSNISVVVTDCTFINNTALTEGGGAIYTNSRYSNVSLVSSRFSYNSASYCSVLDVDEYYHFSVNLTDSVFTHNTATGQLIGGGVACIRNASIDIVRSTFKHNYADLHGGVFYIDESVTSVEGSLFVNNSAAVDGGVFYTYVHASSYNIRGSQFTNNSAGDDGGVLFLGRVNSQVSIDESILSWNNAGDRGGVVAIIASSMFIEINRTNIFNNTASFGGMISACNSEVTVLEEELFVSEDPVYSFCTLYDGDVRYFNITSPRDLDNTIPTSLPTPNVSITSSQAFQSSFNINSNTASTAHLSIASLQVSSSDTINSKIVSTTSQFSSIYYKSLTSLNVIKTKLVENSIINSMFTSMSKTNQIQTTAHDQLSSSLFSSVITTSKYMQELISTSSQISRSSTLNHLNTDTSITVIITPSSTSGSNQVFSSSQNVHIITSVTQEDFTSGVLRPSSVLKSHTESTLQELTSSLPATTRSPGIVVGTQTSNENMVAPTIIKQPNNINYNNYQYNSLHGIINTTLICLIIVIVIVLLIGFLYIYKFMGQYRTLLNQNTKDSKLLLESQCCRKKEDFEGLNEKEEISL